MVYQLTTLETAKKIAHYAFYYVCNIPYFSHTMPEYYTKWGHPILTPCQNITLNEATHPDTMPYYTQWGHPILTPCQNITLNEADPSWHHAILHSMRLTHPDTMPYYTQWGHPSWHHAILHSMRPPHPDTMPYYTQWGCTILTPLSLYLVLTFLSRLMLSMQNKSCSHKHTISLFSSNSISPMWFNS